MMIVAGFFWVVSFFVYLFFEADTMGEYVNAAYFTTSALGIFCSLIHTSIETTTIFLLIDIDINGIVNGSEFELRSNFNQFSNANKAISKASGPVIAFIILP